MPLARGTFCDSSGSQSGSVCLKLAHFILRTTRFAGAKSYAVLACAMPVIDASNNIAAAQSAEIAVYTDEMLEPGVAGVTLHDNYTAAGKSRPDHADGIITNHALTGGTEWAYGLGDGAELGLFLPVYTFSRGARWDGAELRALIAKPAAGLRNVFYGLNAAIDYNTAYWDKDTITFELRGILGWRWHRFALTFNPIIGGPFESGSIAFGSATRFSHDLSSSWSLGIEHYAAYGPLRRFESFPQQSHQFFGVVDYQTTGLAVEAGLGMGLTTGAGGLVMKLMITHVFY